MRASGLTRSAEWRSKYSRTVRANHSRQAAAFSNGRNGRKNRDSGVNGRLWRKADIRSACGRLAAGAIGQSARLNAVAPSSEGFSNFAQLQRTIRVKSPLPGGAFDHAVGRNEHGDCVGCGIIVAEATAACCAGRHTDEAQSCALAARSPPHPLWQLFHPLSAS